MRICPRCGHQNVDVARFCRSCGAPMTPQDQPLRQGQSPQIEPPVSLAPSRNKTNAILLSVVIILAVALVVATAAVFLLRGHNSDAEPASDPSSANPSGDTEPEPSQPTDPDASEMDAYPRYYVTGVTDDGVSLRTQTGENGGELLMQLKNGTEVGLAATDDTAFWYVYVYSEETYGYVRQNYLTDDSAAVTAPATYYVSQDDTLEVYTDTAYTDVKARLSLGNAVTVLAKPAGLYWYVDAAGTYGYVRHAGLSTEKPEVDPADDPFAARPGRGDAPTSSLGTYYVENVAYYLALRSEQAYDTDNELGKLQNGESVEVISQDGEYWYVYSPRLGIYGYANGDYLTKAEPTTVSADTYYVTDVTYYLALRTACTYDEANEIGKIYNGESVTYIRSGTNGYWYVYVPSLDAYGYVNSKYLRK